MYLVLQEDKKHVQGMNVFFASCAISEYFILLLQAGTAELLMEESDPSFPDIPIRVITA